MNEFGVAAAHYIPSATASDFLAQHASITLSRDGFSKGKTFLIFNKAKSKGAVLGLYEKQLKAIASLLTDNEFKNFWEKCTEKQAADFYLVWQSAFNDWATRPAITGKFRTTKINQAKGYIDKIIRLIESDPSLQRDIGIAVNISAKESWPDAQIEYHGAGAYDIMKAERFCALLSQSLGEVAAPDYWQSSHRGYPKQIREPHAERDFFIRRFSPIIFDVLGNNEHAQVHLFLKKLFPHLAFGANPRDTVRKALAE